MQLFAKASIWVLIGLVLSLAAAKAQDEVPSPTGTVELAIRTPQGQAAANSALEITPIEEIRVDKGGGVPPLPVKFTIRATANAKGVARFSWPVGSHPLRVFVEGLGFATTGAFQLEEGMTVRPPLPRLVPLGAIEGTVPKELIKGESYVAMPPSDVGKERRAICNADGHFVFKNVLPGTYGLSLTTAEEHLANVKATATVGPGQRLRVVLRKHADEPVVVPPAEPDEEEQSVWPAGTVRDDKLRPLEGADVYFSGYADGGLRSVDIVHATKTDKQGRWDFETVADAHKAGYPLISITGRSLLAYRAGYPPITVPIWLPPLREPKDKQQRRYDLVLPARGGSLDVTVLKDGQPLAGAQVQLFSQDPLQPDRDFVPFRGGRENPKRRAIDKIVSPTAVTDSQGIAHFRDLAQGTYAIFASSAELQATYGMMWGVASSDDATDYRYALCKGVAVRSGERSQFKARLYPLAHKVQVRLQPVNGKPPPEKKVAPGEVPPYRDISCSCGLVERNNRAGSARVVSNLMGIKALGGPGLWNVEFTYRDPAVFPVFMPRAPYYSASGVFASSPSLPEGPLALLTICRHEPGSLVVEVQDMTGKPAPGVVLSDSFPHGPKLAGSTDEKGIARFVGVSAEPDTLEAYVPGVIASGVGIDGDPLPDDRDLLNRVAFFKQDITPAVDVETRVVLRPAAVGYVRGVIRPPQGFRCADYFIEWPNTNVIPFSNVNYNRESGEFLLGPFAEGKTTVRVLGRDPRGDCPLCASKEVEVRSSQVARVEIRPLPPRMKRSSADAWQVSVEETWRRGVRTQIIHGSVVLPDGTSPAVGAVVAQFYPGVSPAIASGTTDAIGRIYMQADRFVKARDTRPESPNDEVVVALLPGSYGAAIIPLKKGIGVDGEMKIVLPSPITVSGKVMLAGKTVAGRVNQFRVRAAYEGKGNLEELLSVEVTPQADGTFELPGLTPGTYRVQAAMDGIWLSRSTRLTVDKETAKRPPPELDIGEPGTASIIQVVDGHGRAVAGVTATLTRPPGPLAERLWPATLTSDGAGVIHVPPLEAGTHTVHVRRATKDPALIIPPLSDRHASPVKLQTVVEAEQGQLGVEKDR